jgi:23S rRNA (guanosine2251-2'-O)-methyltransferase
VAAEIDLPKVNGVGELIRATEHAPGAPFLLALDRVQDPHNLGALLRTAEAAGVAGMIVPQSRSAALTGTVVKTSAGAAARVPVLSVPNLVRTLDEVKRAGVWTAGLDRDADQTVFEADLTVPLLLVVGGEGEGLRRLTRERCDLLLRLPMAGSIASLNASVAGAIAMYEVVRQRLYASRSSA